jgi:uncharacterized membrane protein YdbT with pleckstrin-like domain
MIVVTIVAVTLVWAFWAPLAPAWVGYLLLLIPAASMVRDALVWRNHKYLVTNRRVIQVFGVFNKNITDSSLEKVNDVRMEQSYAGRVFNFGDIEILTASELGVNRFTFIGNPVEFKTAMLNAKFALESGEDIRPSVITQHPAMDVPRLIQELDELRQKGILTEAEFQAQKAKLLDRIGS